MVDFAPSTQGLAVIRDVPIEVQDGPAFSYRGLMIDTGRHFLPLPFLKRSPSPGLLLFPLPTTFNGRIYHCQALGGRRLGVRKAVSPSLAYHRYGMALGLSPSPESFPLDLGGEFSALSAAGAYSPDAVYTASDVQEL
eukprot:gene11738-10162_t